MKKDLLYVAFQYSSVTNLQGITYFVYHISFLSEVNVLLFA